MYQTTLRNIPEDNHLHIRRRQDLKPHQVYIWSYREGAVVNVSFFSVLAGYSSGLVTSVTRVPPSCLGY
jgi:hypothetical protein